MAKSIPMTGTCNLGRQPSREFTRGQFPRNCRLKAETRCSPEMTGSCLPEVGARAPGVRRRRAGFARRTAARALRRPRGPRSPDTPKGAPRSISSDVPSAKKRSASMSAIRCLERGFLYSHTSPQRVRGTGGGHLVWEVVMSRSKVSGRSRRPRYSSEFRLMPSLG